MNVELQNYINSAHIKENSPSLERNRSAAARKGRDVSLAGRSNFCRCSSISDDTATPTPRPPVRYAILVKILVLYCSTLINAPTTATRTRADTLPCTPRPPTAPMRLSTSSPCAFIQSCYVALSLIQYL